MESPTIPEIALNVLLQFFTICLCEAVFLQLMITKLKYWSTLENTEAVLSTVLIRRSGKTQLHM